MNKSKKIMILTSVIAVTLGLTACGISVNIGTSESESESVSATESETTEATEEETTEATEPETEPETEEETEEATEASAVEAEPEDFTPAEGFSENYADLDNRCFAYDGEIFTLGKSTLQDLVDAGIPFRENELNNIGNNVNKNYSTETYTVKVNDYVSMQFTFMNTTDTNITEAECLLSRVRWYPLYVPQPDYEDSRNEDIRNFISDAADHVSFAFPLTLTKEQLLANNSEPTEENQFNNVTYKVDSDVYIGSSGYTFEFNEKTNQLDNVYISWLP